MNSLQSKGRNSHIFRFQRKLPEFDEFKPLTNATSLLGFTENYNYRRSIEGLSNTNRRNAASALIFQLQSYKIIMRYASKSIIISFIFWLLR